MLEGLTHDGLVFIWLGRNEKKLPACPTAERIFQILQIALREKIDSETEDDVFVIQEILRVLKLIQ